MSIQDIIGPVDAYSASTACVIAAGMALATTSLIMKWQNRTALRLELEKEKYRLDKQTEQMLNAENAQTHRKANEVAANERIKLEEVRSHILELPMSRRESPAE